MALLSTWQRNKALVFHVNQEAERQTVYFGGENLLWKGVNNSRRPQNKIQGKAIIIHPSSDETHTNQH